MTKRTFLITVVACILPLGVLGCANSVDDGDNSDSILRIESVGPSCVLAGGSADVEVGAIPRGGSAGTPLNDVILQRYQITYLSVAGRVGPIDITVLVPADGTGSFTAIVGDPGASTNARIYVEGRDTLGNFASAQGQFRIETACP